MYGTNGGNDTDDKVYLLSVMEMGTVAYGFRNQINVASKTREAFSTMYAEYLENKTLAEGTSNSWSWWLRSPGNALGNNAAFVNNTGYGNGSCSITTATAVRPVVHLDLSNTSVWTHAENVESEVKINESPVPTAVPSVSPSPTVTIQPTQTPIASVSPTSIPTPTKQPSVVRPSEPAVAVTSTPTSEPTLVPSALPTPSLTPDVTVTPKPEVTPQPSALPSNTVTPLPADSAVPTVLPTKQPEVTVQPTIEPSSSLEKQEKTIKKGHVIKDAKSRAYYKVLSVKKGNRSIEYCKPINKKRKSVTIKSYIIYQGKKYKITRISKKAFEGCGSLTKVVLGKNITLIEEKAFLNCEKLTYVLLPEKVNRIGRKAFYGCTNLRYLDVRTTKLTLNRVGMNAFAKGYRAPRVKTKKDVWALYSDIFLLRGISKKALYVIDPVKLII